VRRQTGSARDAGRALQRNSSSWPCSGNSWPRRWPEPADR
jgi:hypothetical protein